MIDDVSRTLEAILDDSALGARFPELLAANVRFDRPDQTFAGSVPPPAAINLFLYDIRENLQLRSNERVVSRNGSQATIVQPPRRIDCSYLVTAWTVGSAPLELREHQLLGQTLQVLGRFPTIPEAYLEGTLAGQEPPLPMMAPQIDGLQSPAEFWTAMGNQLRASFAVTVTISVPLFEPVSGPIVTRKRTDVGAAEPGVPVDRATLDESLVSVGGDVRAAGAGGQPIAGAVVDIVDAGLRTHTDQSGRFAFARVPTGDRNFRVVAVGYQPLARTIAVPGKTEDYEFRLLPL
jgi:hypothetical protein